MIVLSHDGLNIDPVIKVPFISNYESALESMIERVRHIAATMPPPYTLFVSAGIDSQAMLYAWMKSGVNFSAVNVVYDQFNNHDRNEIIQFAELHGFSFETRSFDVIDFLENKLDSYARKYRCASPQICTHMAFSELVVRGTKLFSGNFPMAGFSHIDNTIFGLQRYATISGTPLIPFFLNEGEGAVKAFALSYMKLKQTPSFDPYVVRCEIYKELGFPVIPQQCKYTGFEALKIHYDAFNERVTPGMKLRHASLPSKRVFDQLFRNPYLIEFGNHYPSRCELMDEK